MIDYLNSVEGLPTTISYAAVVKNVARRTCELICDAPSDGHAMLHMLGDPVLNGAPDM